MNEPFSFSPYPMNSVPPNWSRPFRNVYGIGIAARVLIILVVLAGVLLVMGERAEDAGADLSDASDGERGTAVLILLAHLIAGIVFWVWRWRASVNAESMAGPGAQFLSRGWTFWGWWCPVVSLWFPAKALGDIYRASDPRRRPAVIVGCWWAAMLAGVVLYEIVLVSSTIDRVDVNRALLSAAMVCDIVAGALAVAILMKINGWQQRYRVTGGGQQPAVPYWGG